MMKKKNSPWLWIFLVVLALDITMLWYTSGTLLDSDTSSDMVLAKGLSETGEILSRDWAYSTQIVIINPQVIYAFLFHFIDSFRIVRFIGSIIQQIILLSSFFFLCRSANVKWENSLAGASVLILPVNVAWGRIILYHCYYIVHVVGGYLLLGMFIRADSSKEKGRKVYTDLLFALSFLCGMDGIRQMMTTIVPLAVMLIIKCIITDRKQEKPALLELRHQIFLMFGVAAFNVVGMAVNYELTRFYTFKSFYGEYLLMPNSTTYWKDIVYGLVYLFGYRENIVMLTPMGILSVLGVIAFIYYFSVQITALIKVKANDKKWWLNGFFLISLLVLLMVYTFVYNNDYTFILYFLLPFSWIPPMIAVQMENTESLKILHTRRLVPILMAAVLLGNGLINMAWFGNLPVQDQEYEGLGFKNRYVKEDLEGVVQYLSEEGYTWGCSLYWSANIITEMTDGKIKVSSVDILDNMIYDFPWLTFRSYRDEFHTPAFLLVPKERAKSNDFNGIRVYEDDNYYIIRYENSDDLWSIIQRSDR